MNALQIIELILAILGIYFVILRIVAGILYLNAKNNISQSLPPPKHSIVESCPICGGNNIDIFENYDVNEEGEKTLVGYSIGCLYCGLRSPVLNSMEQCVDYWNIRNCEKHHDWVAGEPDVLYQEIEHGEKERQSSGDEHTDNKSTFI